MSLRTSKTALALIPSSLGSSTTSFSNPDRVGRDGYLFLDFERRGDLTVLTRNFFRLPLQVLKASYLENDGSAVVFMVNPTGGIVGGDSLKTEIRLGIGSRVCLRTPSATTVYRALNHPASHETNIHMENGAVLEYFPEHLIPYPDSALRQLVRVQMAAGSCLILNESFAAGRIARHEQWKFKAFICDTEVRIGNSPIYISRSKIVPTDLLPHSLGTSENFNYFASLVVIWDGFSEWKSLVNALSTVMKSVPGVHAGASCGTRSSCVIRIMSFTAAQLASVTEKLWGCIRRVVLAKPEIPLRKY
jgi:urease accessory protein